MNLLITGGTVFASRYTAEYFSKKGHNVYVLNRGTRPQSKGVTLIQCDRHNLRNILKKYEFDAVLDITAYTKYDVETLINALEKFKNYILISSSAVYPETLPQPFNEKQICGPNLYWGEYGINKLAAENYLLNKVPNAYVLRPPYLYGEMNNLYREAFVFECAENDMPFFLPEDGKLPLQFFHINDLCRFIEIILEKQPEQRIFNVGNPHTISTEQWVKLCYTVLGKCPELTYVNESIPIYEYFPFRNYAYMLDVSKQLAIMSDTKDLSDGLSHSYKWYKNNKDLIRRKNYIEYIRNNLL
ncbi:MAG: NAD-dependent epimerase/dehydratase family protein [Ruminococcus sp.]|nr:NAD-dependent epimerase/dehydratase family protein [Ruminococcus sp.]